MLNSKVRFAARRFPPVVAFVANMPYLMPMSNRQSFDKRRSGFARQHAAASTADRQAAARLSALLREDGGARFTVSDDTGKSVDLSQSLLNVLEIAAGMVASGTDVAVLARDQELTSQQVADMLNVSRQYVVRLLDRGDIPSAKVGTHRRVRAGDLAEYRQRRDEGRAAALAAVIAQAEDDGGYDTPATFGPRRSARPA